MGSFTFNIGGEYKALTNEINKKEFRQEVVLDKQNYIVVTPHKDYQWKITDIEDTILGYKVVKLLEMMKIRRLQLGLRQILRLMQDQIK